MATNGNDIIIFTGALETVTMTLVNAYSGDAIEISGSYFVNNAIYDGLDGTDILAMTGNADLLTIKNTFGQQTIFNIETVNASTGGDVIDLSSTDIILGNITIGGANGNDILWANSGNDTVNGGAGNDIIDGGTGNDILDGESGNDIVNGGEGSDTVRGGSGSDTMIGGVGNDTYISESFFVANFTDVITEAAGSDTDVLRFNPDQTLGNLIFTVDGQDLLISANGGIGSIRLTGQFAGGGAGIETLEFDGGVTFTLDAPMLSGAGAAASYTENDAGVAVHPTITVADQGSANLNGAVVKITTGFAAGQDSLNFTDQNGITGVYNPTTGILTLTGVASVADYQAALQSVTYSNSSENPSEASRTITFQVDDGNLANSLSNIVTATVTVSAVNDAPAAAATNNITTDEDTASAPISIGASDLDADTLSYSLKNGFEPSKGSVAFDNGNFTYTPNTNQNGADSFTILINDGQGGVAEQVVSVTIDAVNDAPAAAANNSVTTDEDIAAAAVAIGATDLDGDTLSYSLKSGFEPSKGSVAFDNGNFTYTPTANANGADSFTILIDDGQGGVVEQVVSVTINPVNDSPTAAATNVVTTNEDTASAAVAIGATDLDVDTLSYSLKSGFEPSKGSVAFDNGNFTYTPTANANGADSFTILIDDGQGGVVEQVVSVTIDAVNDAPTAAVTNSVTTNEDTASASTAIGAADLDGDALSYSLKGGFEPAKGSVAFSNGNFTYTPTANENGTDSFTILISDGQGGVLEQMVSVTINAVNDAPTAPAAKSLTTDEDTASVSTAIGAADVDGNALSYSIKSGFEPSKGSVAFDNGNFTYTPTANANGADSFTILIDDGQGQVTEQVVSVTINPVNDAPTASANNNVTTDEDTASNAVAIGAADLDGDTLSYTIKSGFQPSKGNVVFENGNFTYTPTTNANGADSFTILINDGQGGVAEQVVSVTINPVNDAPTAAATNSITTNEDTPSAYTAIGATDVDGNTLSYSLKTGFEPSKGAVSFTNGNFIYTPAANANGADSFKIVINDGQGGVTEQTVSVTIAPVNDAPTAAATKAVTTNQNTPSAAVAIGASDVDGDALTYSLKSGFGPAKGVVTFNANGSFVYTPTTGLNGADSFKILIADGNGGFAEQAVAVTITPVVPPTPAPTDISLSANNVMEAKANGTVVGTLSAVQPGGPSAMTYTLLDNAGGRFAIVGNQLRVADGLALDYEQARTHSIHVQVTNAAGQSYTERLTINVKDVNPESITGDARGNTFVGGAGNDTFNGGVGNDTLKGGAGNDTLKGGDGNDRLYGEAGTNKLYGGNGDDALYGGASNDLLYGDAGNDVIYGGAGNDVLHSGTGNDKLYGEAGNDILWGSTGNNTLDGGVGNDILYGGAGNDLMYGGDGNDILYSNNGLDRLYGGAGDDILWAGNNGDRLDGGAGNDKLYGGAGNDLLKGGTGNDLMYGGTGADQFILNVSGVDTIADFKKSQGDKLNITDILQGFDAGDRLSNFVKMVVSKGDTHVQVNADGVGSDFKTVAILDNTVFKNLDDLSDSLITNNSVIV